MPYYFTVLATRLVGKNMVKAFGDDLFAGKPFNPESGDRLSKNVRHKMRQILTTNEVSAVVMLLICTNISLCRLLL